MDESYYDKNREYILSKMKEKVKCKRCNKVMTRSNIYAHMRTKRCKYIEDINKLDEIRYKIHSDTYEYITMRLKQHHNIYQYHE